MGVKKNPPNHVVPLGPTPVLGGINQTPKTKRKVQENKAISRLPRMHSQIVTKKNKNSQEQQ